MILLPAVDIRDGRAVRLRQGRFDDETVYADDPLEAARSFVEAGANFLHVVDLDGAREGEPVNLRHVERIASELDVAVELGGGLRSIASIRRALGAGAMRVVLGTAEYGSEFVSVVEQPPVYGLQSHPEKSGPDGLRLLKNFVSLAFAPR